MAAPAFHPRAEPDFSYDIYDDYNQCFFDKIIIINVNILPTDHTNIDNANNNSNKPEKRR